MVEDHVGLTAHRSEYAENDQVDAAIPIDIGGQELSDHAAAIVKPGGRKSRNESTGECPPTIVVEHDDRVSDTVLPGLCLSADREIGPAVPIEIGRRPDPSPVVSRRGRENNSRGQPDLENPAGSANEIARLSPLQQVIKAPSPSKSRSARIGRASGGRTSTEHESRRTSGSPASPPPGEITSGKPSELRSWCQCLGSPWMSRGEHRGGLRYRRP